MYTVLDQNVDVSKDIIIQGGARGADNISEQWAIEAGCANATVMADWDNYGTRAGPLRNEWMMRLNPDLIIAFPGGTGTANMIKLAKEAGVEVIEVEEQDE